MSHDQPSALSRRRILELLATATSGIAFTGVLLPIGAYLIPPSGESKGSSEMALVCRAADLPVGEAKVLLHGNRPILVIHQAAGFVALSALCPHLGCAVRWDQPQEVIVCPCHGARFDPQGRVLSGPTPGPLRPVTVRLVGDNVFVSGA